MEDTHSVCFCIAATIFFTLSPHINKCLVSVNQIFGCAPTCTCIQHIMVLRRHSVYHPPKLPTVNVWIIQVLPCMRHSQLPSGFTIYSSKWQGRRNQNIYIHSTDNPQAQCSIWDIWFDFIQSIMVEHLNHWHIITTFFFKISYVTLNKTFPLKGDLICPDYSCNILVSGLRS